MQRIQQLAAISEDADGVTRTFGTPAFLQGRALVQSWWKPPACPPASTASATCAPAWRAPNRGAKTFVLASHIDTVVNAGKFDGPLGVLMGLDLLESLIAQQVELPFHIELIAFSDEEGVRFHTTYLGSKVVAGSFDHGLLARRRCRAASRWPRPWKQWAPTPRSIAADAIPAADWLGYFEMHIEQGPVLWERQRAGGAGHGHCRPAARGADLSRAWPATPAPCP